ncbi:hypothetical protein KS4_27600 [Poriferisphaera corsica]|uniref:Uncharacterized protein n=1 Tax=Poriferisphaera corsica TaxID=2528020 RepID=A0A517YWU2_9BACT|nr:hypothetical protein KS4_27600 [Poriferisphaera corsica]
MYARGECCVGAIVVGICDQTRIEMNRAFGRLLLQPRLGLGGE